MKKVRGQPERFVLLFQDEVTFYRQPSQGWLWSYFGRLQPRMRYSHRDNTRMRIVGYLNATTGATHTEDMRSVTVARLVQNVSKISSWYPDAEKIYLVWDNWPVHAHEKVRKALERQKRVEVIWLPTYSPWLNPIEKLWRRVRQRVSHAHPWCDDFREFRSQVRAEFETFSAGSKELMKYVGLCT